MSQKKTTVKIQGDVGSPEIIENPEVAEDSEEVVMSQEDLEQILGEVLGQMGTSTSCVVNMGGFEYRRIQECNQRRLYLYGEIIPPDDYVDMAHYATAANIIESIININRADIDLPKTERKPIVLYINSPGGTVEDGFAIIETIKLSKTPVITVNVGRWESMAFLIGIAGHWRLSLPNMVFLMHDGRALLMDSANKVRDGARFSERYEKKVIRRHVLKHTKISKKEYKKRAREEFYMLAEDALKYGVIDQIVTDINDIL